MSDTPRRNQRDVVSPRIDTAEDLDTRVDTTLVDELSAITAERPVTGEATLVQQGVPTSLFDSAIDPGMKRLATRLENEAQASSSPRRAALLLHELGRTLELSLGQSERALTAYRHAYDRHPKLLVNTRAMIRLLLERGEHAEATEALAAEIAASATAEERAAALLKRAMLCIDVLGDFERGRADLVAVLDIDDKHPIALAALYTVYLRTGAIGLAISVLERRLRLYEDPSRRSALLCELARLERLRGPAAPGHKPTPAQWVEWRQRLAALYRTAYNTDNLNIHALRSLLEISRKLEDYPVVVNLCRTLADHEPLRIGAALLWDASRIALQHLRNEELALECINLAVTKLPNDESLLSQQLELCERLHRWADASTAIERILQVLPMTREASLWLYRLARIRHERLQDRAGAMSALRVALTHDPEHQRARTMLGRMLSRAGEHEELLKLLESEQQVFTDAARRAATAFRMGDICEKQLGDAESALAHYEAALAHLPGYRPAMRSVTRVLKSMGRFEDLIAVFERELQFVADHDQRVSLLLRIADLWERELSDPSAALPALERLAAIEDDNVSTLRALHRIYRLGTRWRDLVGVIRAEAERSKDPWRQASLLCDVAEIQERQLNDADAALATYLEATDRGPQYQPGLMNAGRLLAKRGDHERIASLHRQELLLCEDPRHTVWLLQKLGRMAVEELDDVELASDVFRRAVLLCGDDTSEGVAAAARTSAATQWYWALHQHRRDDLEVVEALNLAPPAGGAAGRALRRRLIAEAQFRRGKRDLATNLLRQGLNIYYDDAAAQLLQRIYREAGDRKRILGLLALEAEAAELPEQSLSAQLKLAFAYATSEHELHQAIAGYEKVLDGDPRNLVALHQLAYLYAAHGQWSDLAGAIELDRERSEDLDHRTSGALLTAALRELVLGDFSSAAQAAVEVLDRHETHPEALDTLERHARHAHHRISFQQSQSRRVKAAQSAAEQAAELESLAASYCNGGELETGLGYYRLASELGSPPSLSATLGWYRSAQELEDQPQMGAALEIQAKASHLPSVQAAALYEAGAIWKRLDNVPRAIAAYRGVLDAEPSHAGAIAELTALYTDRGDYEDYVSLLDHLIEHTTDPEARRDLLVRMADIQRSRLSDALNARRSIRRGLELFPQDPRLLTNLAELCRMAGDWKGLVEVDEQLLGAEKDPLIQRGLLFELGVVHEDKLGDHARAVLEYRKVLDQDPDDLAALQRLSKLLLEREEWQDAADVTSRLIRRDEDRQRVKRYHLRLATIEAEGFRRLPRAIECCRKALALDPGDLNSSERMADLLQQANDLRGLHAHLESTLTVHRARLERDPFELGSYEALLRVFRRRKNADHIYLLRSLLGAMGVDTEAQNELAATRTSATLVPKRPLTTEEVERILLHPNERGPLERVIKHSEPAMRRVHGKLSMPRKRTDLLNTRQHPELAGILDGLKTAIGVNKLEVTTSEGGLEEITIFDTPTPRLQLGMDYTDQEVPLLRFCISRMLARIRCRHLLARRLGAESWGHSLMALFGVVSSSYTPRGMDSDALEDLHEKFQKALSRRARRNLESPTLELGDQPFEPSVWFTWMEQTEDRVALAATGDIVAAVEVLRSEDAYQLNPRTSAVEALRASAGPRLRNLINFAISEEYLTLRERLGMGVAWDDAAAL